MHDAAGHLAILAGAVLAAYAVSLTMAPGKPAERADAAEVVALPMRPSPPEPAAAIPAPPPQATPRRNDREWLARQIQAELKRVGCYDGEVHGTWTAASRRAMRAFTERVNARLPVDKPDAVLLALVQGEKGEVCTSKCDGGTARDDNGRCRQDAVVARADERAEPVEAVPAKPAPPPAIVPPPPKAAAPPSPPAAVPSAPPQAQPAAEEPREPRMTQAARRHQRRAARQAAFQVRYARSVFRTLRRAASLGLPFP